MGRAVGVLDALMPEFCDVARHLTQLLDLEDRIAFEVGDALATPFDCAALSTKRWRLARVLARSSSSSIAGR